jgi:Putative beta barrel porin-7 (BBP7)
MDSGTKTGWLIATAAALVTASWATAQAPVKPAVDCTDYSLPASPAPRAAKPASSPPPVSAVMPAGLTFEAPTGGLAEAHGASPSAPWPGNPFEGIPDRGPPPYQVWASADFLVWKIHSASLPTLTSGVVPFGVVEYNTGPAGIIHNFAALSLQSTASVATPNLSLNEQFGGRFTAGMWLDPEQSLGIESSFFFLNSRSTGFSSTTDGQINQAGVVFPGGLNTVMLTGGTLTQTNTAFVVRQANADLAGTFSNGLWGAELNARCASTALGAVSSFVGFRYINFHEDLAMQNSAQAFLPSAFDFAGVQPGSTFPANVQFNNADTIKTHNDFYGGQVGLNIDMFVNRFILDLRGKVALGVMHQSADVFGSTTTTSQLNATSPPNVATTPGGLLSGPLDNGTHSRNVLSWAPELNAKVGYMVTPSIRAYLGYDFLYLWNVLRPSDLTGLSTSGATVTVAGVPNPLTVTQPAFQFKDSNVWVQGVNVGVEIRY